MMEATTRPAMMMAAKMESPEKAMRRVRSAPSR